MTKASSKRN